MEEYVLQTHGIVKKYRGRRVLDGVDINVRRGDIYGFVGENGSGKTTVIRAITGLIFPEEGSFELFGVSSESAEILSARKRIGAIVETPSIYLGMSARENLLMQCGILSIKDEELIKSVLAEVGLSELYSDSKKAGNFSLGMRQRLGLAMCLLGSPEFIILDEPMNGLDPAGIVEVRELILKLNRERGITFMISSHILSELGLVATKYGIISKGKILTEITSEDLKNACRPSVFVTSKEKDALVSAVSELYSPEDYAVTGVGIRVFGDVDLNALLGAVIGAGVPIASVNCVSSGIEEYYLSLVGGGRNA